MKGRTPKKPELRQRRNKVTSRASLPSEQEASGYVVPDLPERKDGWHPMVLEWWTSIWRSPMASEYLDADMRGGLFNLAKVHEAAWRADDKGDVRAMLAALAEIRLQEVRFGLSPIDRRRLQWTIEQGESAAERTQARRAGKPPKKGSKADPRGTLKLA